DIKTEVFLLPSAQVAEMAGSFTNTQRWIQWHEKAVDPPGDCRSDSWFTHNLYKRLQKLYQGSTLARDQSFLSLLWDFDYEPGSHLNWAYSWPANRRILYNRASARPDGQPWSERKKWVWWDGQKWTGNDVPDFTPTKAPTTPARPDGTGLDAHSGSDPFIMK